MKPHLKWNGSQFVVTNPSLIQKLQVTLWIEQYYYDGKFPYNTRDAQ